MVVTEEVIEYGFIGKLENLKYDYRADIRDRAALERNFREKFQALNRVHLSDGEFARLLDEIVTPDVFTAARTLRERNAFTRDDGTPLNYTLVNIKDWCKNSKRSANPPSRPILNPATSRSLQRRRGRSGLGSATVGAVSGAGGGLSGVGLEGHGLGCGQRG